MKFFPLPEIEMFYITFVSQIKFQEKFKSEMFLISYFVLVGNHDSFAKIAEKNEKFIQSKNHARTHLILFAIETNL